MQPKLSLLQSLSVHASQLVKQVIGNPMASVLGKVDKPTLTRVLTNIHKFASDGILQLCALCTFNAIVPAWFVLKKKETPECTKQDKIYDASRVFCNDIVAMAIIAGNAALLKKGLSPLFTPARATRSTKELTQRFFSSGSTIVSDFLLIPYATTVAIHKGLNPILKKLGIQTGEKKEAPDTGSVVSTVSTHAVQPATMAQAQAPLPMNTLQGTARVFTPPGFNSFSGFRTPQPALQAYSPAGPNPHGLIYQPLNPGVLGRV